MIDREKLMEFHPLDGDDAVRVAVAGMSASERRIFNRFVAMYGFDDVATGSPSWTSRDDAEAMRMGTILDYREGPRTATLRLTDIGVRALALMQADRIAELAAIQEEQRQARNPHP